MLSAVAIQAINEARPVPPIIWQFTPDIRHTRSSSINQIARPKEITYSGSHHSSALGECHAISNGHGARGYAQEFSTPPLSLSHKYHVTNFLIGGLHVFLDLQHQFTEVKGKGYRDVTVQEVMRNIAT